MDYVIVAKYVPGRKSGHGRWNASLLKCPKVAADVGVIASMAVEDIARQLECP